MRAKRSKKYRKIVSSYTLHFSFRTPYQVLCSASFLQQCYAFSMPVSKSLSNTLHGDAKPYITQCSLAKAVAAEKGKGRGDGKPVWLPPPMEVPLRYCKHRDGEGKEAGVIGETECLLDLLGGGATGNEVAKNKNHYVLATAEEVDEDEKEQQLRKQRARRRSNNIGADVEEKKRNSRKRNVDVREFARQIPGVPIVYVKRSVMILEELSAASEKLIRGVEREKFRDGLIGDARGLKRKRDEDDEDEDDDSDANNTTRQSAAQRRGASKAKGPNPLSIRKKKARPVQGNSKVVEGKAEASGASNEQQQQKKRRKRKRGNKGDEQNGDVLDAQAETALPRVTGASVEAET